MFGKTIFAAAIALIAMSFSAVAQTPKQIKQFDYWAAYSYQSNKGTVCYIIALPTDMAPSTVNHGDNYFLISKRPDTNAFEPQFMAGYNLRDKSNVTVTVGSNNFTLFTNQNSAWASSADDEQKLVAAMRAGATMSVKGVSQRGTNTTYTYSLKGVTAALNAIQTCK